MRAVFGRGKVTVCEEGSSINTELSWVKNEQAKGAVGRFERELAVQRRRVLQHALFSASPRRPPGNRGKKRRGGFGGLRATAAPRGPGNSERSRDPALALAPLSEARAPARVQSPRPGSERLQSFGPAGPPGSPRAPSARPVMAAARGTRQALLMLMNGHHGGEKPRGKKSV